MASCVLQGERGVGLAGPAGQFGPPGLKVRFRFSLILVSHHMCHSPQTNCGLISGRSRSSWITWSSRATGEAWWYWATRSERWNRTVWTSWSTRECGWCSCWIYFYFNPAAWFWDCFWFQGVQGFAGSPGKAGPPGPPGPPGQAVSLYYILRTTGWDVKLCLFSNISNHVLDQLKNNRRNVEVCLRRLTWLFLSFRVLLVLMESKAIRWW